MFVSDRAQENKMQGTRASANLKRPEMRADFAQGKFLLSLAISTGSANVSIQGKDLYAFRILRCN